MIALAYILAISLGVLALIARLLPKQHKHLISKREYAAVVYLPVVMTFSPHFAVFCLLVIGFMALIPATAEERFRLFFFSLHLIPSFLYVILAPAPINYLFSFNSYLLLVLGCSALIFTVPRSVHVRLRKWDALFFLLMCGLMLAGVKDTTVTNTMRVIVETSLLVGLPYLLISRGVSHVRSPTDILFAIILGATILAAITAFESQRNWLLYDDFGWRYGMSEAGSAYAKQRGGFLRASATFPEPTSLSLFFALATVILVALQKQIARPLAFYVLLGFLAMGLVFTLSRIGLLVVVVGFAALLWHQRRYAMLVAAACAAPIAYLALNIAADYVPVLAALLGQTGDATVTVDYRDRLADRMIEEIQREPWFGLTPSEINIRLSDMRQGEGIIDLVNTPLSIALQSGLVGLMLFLVPPIALLFVLVRMRRQKDRNGATAANAIFACLLAFEIGLITTGFHEPTRMWMIVLLGLGTGLYASRRTIKREERTSADEPSDMALAAAE